MFTHLIWRAFFWIGWNQDQLEIYHRPIFLAGNFVLYIGNWSHDHISRGPKKTLLGNRTAATFNKVAWTFMTVRYQQVEHELKKRVFQYTLGSSGLSTHFHRATGNLQIPSSGLPMCRGCVASRRRRCPTSWNPLSIRRAEGVGSLQVHQQPGLWWNE